MLITAGVFALASLPTFLLLKERAVPRPTDAIPCAAPLAEAWREVWHTLRQTRQFADLARFLLCSLFYQAGIQTVITLAAVYAGQAMGFGTRETLLLVFAVNITAAIGAFGFGPVQDRIGHVRAIALTLGGWIVTVLIAWAAPVAASGETLFWIAANLAGLCMGAAQSAGRALVGLLAPSSRLAEFYGFWGLSVKLASIAGPLSYGIVTWASGALAEPQRASDYPLVGVEAAVARLNDESGQWMQYGVSPMVAARMEVSGGTGVATATVVGGSDDTQSEPGEAGSVTATGEATPVTDVGGAPASLPDQIGEPVQIVPTGCDASAPCESYVPEAPEAITVTLTDVHLGLSMVWAQDGTVWLLPAYTFTAADDGQYSVIAVDDSFIALPDPVLVDPMPIEPAPETVPVDPASVPAETTVVPPSDGSATSVDLGAAQEVLVGLTVEEATRVAADNGWTVRVSTLEGEPQPVTMDLQSNRVNLSVADGIVTGLDGIG